PGDPPALHWTFSQGDQAWLASCDASGVSVLPLAAASQAIPPDAREHATWLAEPSVAAQAERALDRRPELVPLAEWLLRCTHNGWNLAQFDLSLSGRARRGQRARELARRFFFDPAWRPARWGLASLLLTLLLGLNGVAWSERNSLKEKQTAIARVLQTTFPEVTVVLDAPAQMRRSLSLLRQTGGNLSSDDLEAVLASLPLVVPDATPGKISFAPGDIQLEDWTMPEARLQALTQALQERGWQASLEGGSLRLRPKAP
ncbi:MAG: hypothetical protein KDF54_12040, partial [Hydrogenophaga sp.]|nr:hypothetical protein [Hydrogenophaga sp.]